MHRLGQMRRSRMLEEQKAWKREDDFDYIDTAAEMDARRSRTNLVSESFFYSKISNPRWPHIHDEFTLEMRVDVERLRMEIVLPQPEPPPQCDASPRRLHALDTGLEEPGTPRRLPAVGTGSDEPRVSRAESTERAAMHRLVQMRRSRMLEEQKAWEREADFDCIDTAAEMDARRSRTNLVSGPFFYSKMSNPRWPHIHGEFTHEMRVDVGRLRMGIILSQPEPPPQCDASPRRLPAVDTGLEKPETPRRLPAIGTGSDEPGVSRAESTERAALH